MTKTKSKASPDSPELFRTFKSEIKSVDQSSGTGKIAGYFSIMNNIDQGCDRVLPGAFARTIASKNGRFPFLLDHDPTRPCGYTTIMSETEKGVYYESEWQLFSPEVKQRFELCKQSLDLGQPMGNSFGYYPIKFDYEMVETEGGSMMIRNLREIKLFEVTSCVFPMNESAGVTDAKSREILELFASAQKRGYGFDELKNALLTLAERPRPEPAEPNGIDPVLRHSMEALGKVFA